MTDNSLPDKAATPLIQPRKVSRWLFIVVPVVFIIILCTIVALLLSTILKVNVQSGDYSIDKVILSSDLQDNQPVDIKNEFKPSDTIICTVKTTGGDSIISMKWYSGDRLIYENTGKTQNNTISTYIQSSRSAVIPEGEYHVDILILSDVLETVYFTVKVYHPNVVPQIAIPAEHRNIEDPWFPEVPFAFDEVWIIDGIEWNINEAKVVLIDDSQEYFVAIVVNSDIPNLHSLSEGEVKDLTRPIALFALNNGYIEKARSLQIDGRYYDLDQYIFVNIISSTDQQAYRVKFTMDELTR